MPGVGIQLLDTTPKWLGLTLVCSACALVVTGIGILVNQLILLSITPFSLLLHFAAAISLSAWILNLRIQMTPDRKPLFTIGIAAAVGSIWSSLEQWFGYLHTALTDDTPLVAGALLIEAAGGSVTSILFQAIILR